MEILIIFKKSSRFFDISRYELRDTRLELFDKNDDSIIIFKREDIIKYSIFLNKK